MSSVRGKPKRGRSVKPRPAPPTSVAREARTNGTAASANGPRRKCVLVVEDNASIGGLLVALLREEGYRALRAWDVREGIRIANDRTPDLIVLDTSLPYRDGFQALAELRADEKTRSAPIVVVAANGLQLSADDEREVAALVSKPFDVDKLLNVFRRVLGDPEQAVPERHFDVDDVHLHSW